MGCSKALGFLQSFIVAKSLGPEHFGIWVTLMLVMAYGPIVCLGTGETLLKKVPYHLGRNELHKVREVESAVFGSVVLSALAVMVLIAGILPLFRFLSVALPPVTVAMMLVTVAANYFSSFFTNRFAAYEDFRSAGAIEFLRAFNSLLFVGVLGWKWGLEGAVLGFLLQELFTGVIAISWNIRLHGGPGMSFQCSLLVEAVRIGFPITIVWWILILQNSVDRVVLGSMLGPVEVGYYGLGISITSALAIIPMVVGRVIYPKINKEVGQSTGTERMRKLVLVPTIALSVLLANVQVVILGLMPVLYQKILPKYGPGLLSGQILLLGAFYVCLMRNAANYLIASNREKLLLAYVMVSLIFNVLVDVALVLFGYGIEGVAIGTSLAGLLLNTLLWRRVLLDMDLGARKPHQTLLALYIPSFILWGVFAATTLLHGQFLLKTDYQTVLFCFACLCCLNVGLLCVKLIREEMFALMRTMPLKTRTKARLVTHD